MALIDQQRAVWQSKPVLRAIYKDYHNRMLAACRPGSILEIGGGGGHMKEYSQEVVSLDIQYVPWLDVVADAHSLPFPPSHFDNLVMLDVLHHLAAPCRFIGEALRVLRPGGRIVLLEPAITPVSWFFYKLFHREPVNMRANPLGEERLTGPRPEDSNQAIPMLLFGPYLNQLEETFPELNVRQVSFLSLLAYPLSGGFQSWSLLPRWLVNPIVTIEDWLLPLVGRLAGFRMFIVAERKL